MNGIIININPVIFHFGPFGLHWYSLMIILAVVAAVLITARRASQRAIAVDHIYSLAIWVVLGGIIGARLFHVVDYWQYYASNPLQMLQFQQGGLAIWGALAGGGIAAITYAMIKHLPVGRLVDTTVPGLLVAQMIGRVGCIVNGDAYGGVTNLPWAFIYTNPGASIPANLFGQPTHPYPAYEIIWNGLALLIILRLESHFQKDGLLFLSYLSFYSLGRFVLTFVRQENITLWGLQQAQIVALLVLLICLIAMLYISRRPVPEEVA